jgi:hypothetical protein
MMPSAGIMGYKDMLNLQTLEGDAYSNILRNNMV